jgi:hypothetical protein
VITNDTDVDLGDTLTLTAVSTSGTGTVSINSDGFSVDYTPSADFNGTEVVTYTVSDGTLTDETGTLTVTVTSVNDAPEAFDDTFTLEQGNTQVITLSAIDIDEDELVYSIVSDPNHGTISIDGDQATYIADDSYSGSDSFTFIAFDGELNSNEAIVSIDVTLDILTQQLSKINGYPNPFHSYYIINNPIPIEVEIYDVNGRIFINKYLEIGENIINTSHLSSGFYLIKLTHNNRKKVDILIKK